MMTALFFFLTASLSLAGYLSLHLQESKQRQRDYEIQVEALRAQLQHQKYLTGVYRDKFLNHYDNNVHYNDRIEENERTIARLYKKIDELEASQFTIDV